MKIDQIVSASTLLLLIAFSACSKTENPTTVATPQCDGSTPTYQADIKAIVEASCNAGSGCHGSGSSLGDYTTFAGLEPDLTNGSFKREVIDQRTMPPGNATMTDAELNMIQCWIQNGYAEK